ncbi:MAG: serine/threonine protein kinase, partial [Planctomycetes bacterium]|nr:serine/threonine protein kinase [Planctomycetota bacterium]
MEKKPFSTRNLAGEPPPGDGGGETVCPYCDHRFGAGGLNGYVYCPACGKRFNPGSLLAETVVLSPEMTTKVLVASPADADTAVLPAVPVVDEESEAKRFGDYDILSEVARGGMGVVYRARHRLLKRVVALKVLRAGEGASQEDISRFMQEAKAVASLSHPNIVPIHELSVEKGQYYFTMNFIEGWSLDQIIERQKLSPYRACEIIETIARAIHYAHTKGIIHRDIKPANVIMSEDNRPMITDFGLAVNLSTNREERRMTRDGSVMGTIPYIPPEQAAGRLEDIGPRSDVYSLGAMFYEMLTGRPPFTGMTQYELLQRVINQYPPTPRKLNPRINADLDTICMKCLAKEPERRYQTALALAEDCRAFLNGDVIKARPTTLLYRVGRLTRRYPVQAALAALVLLLGLAVLAIANFAQETRQELVTQAGEHQQTVEEKKKLDERVERPWREDFCLRLTPRPNLTENPIAARNQQLCWVNRGATEARNGQLLVRPAGSQPAFGIPVNLPARYRLVGKFAVVDDGPGNSQLEILFGVDRVFMRDERSTMALAIGTRGNPGARLTLNGTVLAENNAFFLEKGQEYAFEIVQSGAADAGLADGESYQMKNFSLLVDDKEIFSTMVPPASELRAESFFALAARGLTVAISRFDVNIPGLNQEMIKSLLEVGDSLSGQPGERSLARLLYRRVLRERVPVSVILQVYLGFAKTTIDRDHRRHPREDVGNAFRILTANLNQSRGELIYEGELEYGYGLTLAMGNRAQEAERYFVEACRKAEDAARKPLAPQAAVWVGAFRPYDYSPLVAPFDRDEKFATISG